MTSPVIDAGDGLPLTVPALLRAGSTTGPTTCCWSATTTASPTPRRTSAPPSWPGRCWPPGASAGTRVALLHPNGPDFVVAWLAAARIGAVSVPAQHVLDQRRAGRPAARRRRGAPPGRGRRTARTTTRPACGPASPTSTSAPRRRCWPRRCRRCAASRSPSTGLTAIDPGWTMAGLLAGAPAVDDDVLGRGRGGGDARRPDGDRAHVGLDQRAQGRDPHPRRRSSATSTTSTSCAATTPARCCSRTRRSSGSAGSPTPCSARSWPGRRWCARTPPTPPACSTCSSGSARRWSTGSPPRSRTCPTTRRSRDRDLSSIRRGNLWPIMPADGAAGRSRAAPRHARHDRGRQRLPGQRRRVRAARAPPGLVRHAGARVRGPGASARRRTSTAGRARSACCGSGARS